MVTSGTLSKHSRVEDGLGGLCGVGVMAGSRGSMGCGSWGAAGALGWVMGRVPSTGTLFICFPIGFH